MLKMSMADLTTVVPDFGIGNLASIVNMSRKLGFSCTVINNPEQLYRAGKIILAGVGAFDHGMSMLEDGWRNSLEAAVLGRNTPVLGICLGMQLLCKRSDEGRLPGLGWVDAEVLRFNQNIGSNLKIPHMGWNTIRVVRENSLVKATDQEQRFYFVHSFHVVPRNPEIAIALSTHGIEFCAAFQEKNIFGVQFHPEKSHRFGMELIKRFMEI